MPTDADPSRFKGVPERMQVSLQVGQAFYRQSRQMLDVRSTRLLIKLDPELNEQTNQDPLLRIYKTFSGRTTEFKNSLGQQCSVDYRDTTDVPELDGALEFTVTSMADETDETVGDWIDFYLLSPEGVILAAEHRVFMSGDPHASYTFGPIAINPELLLNNVQTAFKPAA